MYMEIKLKFVLKHLVAHSKLELAGRGTAYEELLNSKIPAGLGLME